MAVWLNHVVIAAPRNGTTAHICDPSNVTGGGTVTAGVAFTPTAGRFLLAVGQGAVTFTTPSGWTLPTSGSAINNGGLYVFYLASAAGGDTFTTTQNGSNYPVNFDVYEFPAGTTFGVAATSTAVAIGSGGTGGGAGPTLTKSATSASVFGALGSAMTGTTGVMSWTWTGGGTKNTDTFQLGAATDGGALTVVQVDGVTATTAAYAASVTVASGAPNLATAERLMFSVIPAGGAAAAIPNVNMAVQR